VRRRRRGGRDQLLEQRCHAVGAHAARAGDTLAASQTLELVLSGSADAARDDDPFWTYHEAAGRDAEALLAEANRLLTQEATP